ncbi:MAG TPA: dTDP-4-dehydrorhamnose reductase [Thermoleophilaceae bacterium]
MRALVTGGGGQLASDLAEQLPDAVAPCRTELDITDDDAVARTFADVEPEVVFNCAAFHNVEVCETEEDRSFEVNARAVKRLAQRCEETGGTLVHLSTNYVFDGTRPDPYAEDDRPNPRSIYALSKLAGEYAALAYCSRALVVRSAGLYGRHGSASKGGNFVTRMIARAREQGQLKMVADQRLNPTFTGDLAAGVIAAVDSGARGVLHITNSGECSWHEFTVEIMRLAGIDVPIEPVETTRRPGAADRPLNGVLARPRTDAAGLAPLRSWGDALADYLAS